MKTITTLRGKNTIVSFVLIICMIAAFLPMTGSNTYAASKEKTKTCTNDVLYASGGLKALDIYGRDTFTFKYDGKKVISCKTSQSAKNLGTSMCEKGGIKCTKKTNEKWTYRSTWYVNFSVLPKSIKKIFASQIGDAVSELSDLGRMMTVVTEYTIDKNGNFKYKQVSYKIYVPQKLQSAAKWIAKNLVKGSK